ncbi:MAG: cytochrome c3 family protein [Myxococcales bacterium]|nr:cytochrome c3 family protein [Myxococcales bacterium]
MATRGRVRKTWGALASVAVLALVPPASADEGAACLQCHQDQVSAHAYDASVHTDLACTACHKADPQATPPSGRNQKCSAAFVTTQCSQCHAEQSAKHDASVHGSERSTTGCVGCHSDIHSLQSHKGDKLRHAETCSGCHSRQQAFFDSVHYLALEQGNADAPACTDCHGTHDVARVDNDSKGREFHTRACLTCHDDAEKMKRSDVTPIAGKTFFEGFHGKNVSLGYPEKVAGCADCHGSHQVLAAEDPASKVNAKNLPDTCGQCHAGASASFTRYNPHADDRDRSENATLYWTRIAMTTLLVVTFLFFWVHSVLWALRSFIERRAKLATGLVLHPPAKRTYRRFTPTQIALHMVVVVSFLTLAFTGLPLKFAGTGWGRSLMSTIGGPQIARHLHHSAAVVTFGYFSVALVMSFRFLFRPARPGGTWWSRLVGPDSLLPVKRDWTDMKAMFRWFFFKGPKPTFERWTYWEKFDFLAVFWGMFAIGLSGLLLWFPEAAAHVVPGWMFNVATIVHSDEALLATGFIFTVHFFNTHFRPEKFPMDTVIFDGRVSDHEMSEERGDQLARLRAEGRLEELVVESPTSLGWSLFYRAFGFGAVALGLSLAVAMGWALMTGH